MSTAAAPIRRRSIGNRRNPASQAAILAAARALLREGGPDAASIEAIARTARASKPTLYRWWSQRGALMLELFETQAALDPPPVPRPPAGLGRAQQLIAHWFALAADPVAGGALRAIRRDGLGDPRAAAIWQDAIAAPLRGMLWRALEAAGDDGALSPDAPLALALEAVLALLVQALDAPAQSAAIQIEQAMELLVRLCSTPQAR